MMKRVLKRLYLSAAACASRDDSAKVVFYHDVGRANTPMGTDAALFAAHVRVAKRRGWAFAPALGPFLERPAEKSLLLCFDDGFRGVWENRAFFREEGLRPLVFLAVRLVGLPGYLTWDEIRCLRDEFGFRFGGHTWSHQTLAGEMIDESPKEARTDAWFARELTESREFLSRRLGESVDALCFPAGHFSADVVRRCAAAGYRWLFTSVPGRIPLAMPGAGGESGVGGVVLLPRVLCQDLSASEFAAVLRGGMSRLSGRYLRQHFS